jgi:hypothetical protein
MDQFNEAAFRAKVDSALSTVRTILDTTKHPKRPSDGKIQLVFILFNNIVEYIFLKKLKVLYCLYRI